MRYSFLKKIIGTMVLSLFLLQAVCIGVVSALEGNSQTTGSSQGINTQQTFQMGTANSGSGLSGVAASSKAGTFGYTIYSTILVGILQPLIKLMIALAIVFFLWGVVKFIKEEGGKKEEGKEFMFWGIVGIFVMVSVWGLVNILTNTFKLDTSGIKIPTVDIQ